MSFRPTIIYRWSPKLVNTPFKQFFYNFCEKAIIECSSTGGNKLIDYLDDGEEKQAVSEAFERFKELKVKRREDPTFDHHSPDNPYGDPDFYEKSYLLSIANDLLLSLSKDLISQLVLISSYRKGQPTTNKEAKIRKFSKTFKKFPNTIIQIFEVAKIGKQVNVPHR